jgi:hypothetical protein
MRKRQKRSLKIEVLQRCPKYIQCPLCYISGIVLVSLKHVKRITQRRDRMKEEGIEAKLSEGQENARRGTFDNKGGSGVTRVKGKRKI